MFELRHAIFNTAYLNFGIFNVKILLFNMFCFKCFVYCRMFYTDTLFFQVLFVGSFGKVAL